MVGNRPKPHPRFLGEPVGNCTLNLLLYTLQVSDSPLTKQLSRFRKQLPLVKLFVLKE